MILPNAYFIAGCNGAGKTTASFTLLPEILDCKEFINADGIAAGISPFQPEKVSVEAGKILLDRIDKLAADGIDFAVETTLSGSSYVNKVKYLQSMNYDVMLLFFWIESPEVAINRIAERVTKGGHYIPDDVVVRRYYRGIENLFRKYVPVVDYWMVFDNSQNIPVEIASGKNGVVNQIGNIDVWNKIKAGYNERL